MSHPQQGRPADQQFPDQHFPDEQVTDRQMSDRQATDRQMTDRQGHERPGGYDEDPRQNAGAGYGAQPGPPPGQQAGQQIGQHPGQQAGPPPVPQGGAHAAPAPGGQQPGGDPGAYPGPPDRGRGAPGEPAHAGPQGGMPGEHVDGGADARHENGAGQPTIIDPRQAEQWRSQWEDVRMMFVDQPRDAVARADGLVGEVLDELARTFTQQRSALDPNAVGDPSTEELRRAVQRYREFFDRLLTL